MSEKKLWTIVFYASALAEAILLLHCLSELSRLANSTAGIPTYYLFIGAPLFIVVTIAMKKLEALE